RTGIGGRGLKHLPPVPLGRRGDLRDLAGEIGGVDLASLVRIGFDPQAVVGDDHDGERIAGGGRTFVVVDDQFRPAYGAHVGAALQVVPGNLDVIRSQPVTQINHALAGIVCVGAFRVLLHYRAEGRERLVRRGGRTLREVDVEKPLDGVRLLLEVHQT